MKNKKEIIIIALILIICALLYAYQAGRKSVDNKIANSISESLKNTNQSSEDNLKESINKTVNDLILGENEENTKKDEIIDKEEDETQEPDNKGTSISDAIKDTLNNINKETYDNKEIEIISVDSSNKLTVKKDGEEFKIRLIGVHANGSSDGLSSLLESATDLRIETDTKKKDGDYTLAYLWDGEPTDNGKNMINIQMIVNEYAYSTYDFVHPGVIETPNIKYQSLFIDAIKSV